MDMLYFKLPFSDQILTTGENSDRNAVNFISFNGKETLNFFGNISTVKKEELIAEPLLSDQLSIPPINFEEESKQDYLQKLKQVIALINANHLAKLVISRRKKVPFEKLNLTESFLNLCQSYPNAFSYLFLKDGKSWIGAFSEVLGKFNKKTSEFETMSLAGTLPLHEEWTSKEIEEQKPVTDYIAKVLAHFSTEVQQSETYSHESGNIKHLRTDFKTVIDKNDLEQIISALHPTPAVCGIPKQFCEEAIQKFEKYPRNFYAGYIRYEDDETVQYFVNLRCAELFSNAALLYVGGGITADSSPENEWRETELKAEAIMKNLDFLN